MGRLWHDCLWYEGLTMLNVRMVQQIKHKMIQLSKLYREQICLPYFHRYVGCIANTNYFSVLFGFLWQGDIWLNNQIYSQFMVACAFFAYIFLKCGIWKIMEHVFESFHVENPHFITILTFCDGGTKNRKHADLPC